MGTSIVYTNDIWIEEKDGEFYVLVATGKTTFWKKRKIYEYLGRYINVAASDEPSDERFVKIYYLSYEAALLGAKKSYQEFLKREAEKKAKVEAKKKNTPPVKNVTRNTYIDLDNI